MRWLKKSPQPIEIFSFDAKTVLIELEQVLSEIFDELFEKYGDAPPIPVLTILKNRTFNIFAVDDRGYGALDYAKSNETVKQLLISWGCQKK